MRQAIVKYNHIIAGLLTENDNGEYLFKYEEQYVKDCPNQFISFDMPVRSTQFKSKRLFPFFDGLIPEGWVLNIASESWKIHKNDRMGLLLACCQNAIGAVSIHPINAESHV